MMGTTILDCLHCGAAVEFKSSMYWWPARDLVPSGGTVTCTECGTRHTVTYDGDWTGDSWQDCTYLSRVEKAPC